MIHARRKFAFPLSDVDASEFGVTMAIQPIDGCGLESKIKRASIFIQPWT